MHVDSEFIPRPCRESPRVSAPPRVFICQAKAARTRSSRSLSAAWSEIDPRAARAMATAESSTSGGSSGGPTRLLLTNLHPSVSTSHLRAHLERCPSPSNAAGALTDLKVLSRPDGTSRCIAFAGFKRHSDAERVREWLDGTWVAGERGGARVKADWAKEVRDFFLCWWVCRPPLPGS